MQRIPSFLRRLLPALLLAAAAVAPGVAQAAWPEQPIRMIVLPRPFCSRSVAICRNTSSCFPAATSANGTRAAAPRPAMPTPSRTNR